VGGDDPGRTGSDEGGIVSGVELYPAIDLRNGKAVRLVRGDFDAETVYEDDPVAAAASFAADGVRWLHVVDLDAARTGDPVNRSIIGAIASAVDAHGVWVQAGGGVRSEEAAAALADVGVARVVIGSAALEEPDMVERVAARQPVAIGLDGRSGAVAVHGWRDEVDVNVFEAMSRFEGIGVEAFVLTEITRDGTLEGPDLDALREALARTATPVIASGGVGSLDDLEALAALEYDGRHLAGVIVGKALYEHRFRVAKAMSVLGSV
jgi:phosphoribosylformimino-5-aminoimidazole carboxamide ribotide isomerase